jgi:3-hydroxymyristoyl/3-hydroxydecanoyl-(acyl carrier protein) dehydratase
MTEPTAGAPLLAPRLAPEVFDEKRGDDAWVQRLRVPSDLDCWPGHFPGHPVVPGVLQVHWAMTLLERWLGHPLASWRIEVLKFKQLLRPGRELTLRVSRGRGAGRFDFALADGDEVFASGRVATGEDAVGESGSAP